MAVYALIYILMRLAKRDAAQLTASDFVVVLLLSNVVQNAIIGPDNSFVGGAVGAVTLIVVNEIVARWEWARKMARADRAHRRSGTANPRPSRRGWSAACGPRGPTPSPDRRREVQEWALQGTRHLAARPLRRAATARGRQTRADIEWAEIRTGGAIDYKLKPAAEPATKGDMDDLHRELRELRDAVGRLSTSG